eukprot:6501088-Ditylum_brightwellii.AAC.1
MDHCSVISKVHLINGVAYCWQVKRQVKSSAIQELTKTYEDSQDQNTKPTGGPTLQSKPDCVIGMPFYPPSDSDYFCTLFVKDEHFVCKQQHMFYPIIINRGVLGYVQYVTYTTYVRQTNH